MLGLRLHKARVSFEVQTGLLSGSPASASQVLAGISGVVFRVTHLLGFKSTAWAKRHTHEHINSQSVHGPYLILPSRVAVMVRWIIYVVIKPALSVQCVGPGNVEIMQITMTSH